MLHLLAQIPLEAERYPATGAMGWFGALLTNSIVVAVVVMLIILLLAHNATKKMELVPGRGGQNVFEMLVEAVYSMIEGVVGRHMVARTFPLLATFFIFILFSNWFGLLPGVGTIGFGRAAHGAGLSLQEVDTPLLRPANADLNLTLGMALIFTVFWLIWSFQELGVGGFLGHIFGPKGGVKGVLAYALMPIFLFVGVIEVISIAFRPVSLSLRLFGNIYAGENLMHTMGSLGAGLPTPLPFLLGIIIPIPFYFLELLVGVVQALVFTLLCAVYIQLTTSHEGGDHAEHGAHDDARHTGAEQHETLAAPVAVH